MRRPSVRLAAGCALVAATAIMTSTALADPGNGNSANAPGQVKQEQQAAQPAAQPQAPAPAKQTQAPGQVKKAQKTQASTASPQAGVKPSSTTKHWTHTTVGAKPDVSKRYGNGKTAAQIAHGRGAPDSQPLTGPGNSQPHKTYDCAHKNNKSGGVDVHAIKSYDASCQTQQQTQVQVQTQAPAAPCGFIVAAQQTLLGVMHVNGQGRDVHLMTNPHSAHFKGKHADDHLVMGTTFTLQPDSSQNCGTQPAQQQAPVQIQQVAPVTQNAVGALPATQGLPIAAAAPAAGVLGAQTTLATPKPASHGGVLGTVTRVSGASLPFTGFPVWVAVLIALALVAGGLLVRRHSSSAA